MNTTAREQTNTQRVATLNHPAAARAVTQAKKDSSQGRQRADILRCQTENLATQAAHLLFAVQEKAVDNQA